MLVNGNAIAARRLDGPIADGKYYTFVEVSDDALPELVLDLKRSIREIKAQNRDSHALDLADSQQNFRHSLGYFCVLLASATLVQASFGSCRIGRPRIQPSSKAKP